MLVTTGDEATGRAVLQDQAAAHTVASAAGQLVLVDLAHGATVTGQVLGLGPRPLASCA